MKSSEEPKNIKYENGVKYYKRWTVLDVNADVIEAIKNMASTDKTSVGKALEKLAQKQLRRKEGLKIGLDYWQVISHYTEYFRDFAQKMMAAGHEIYIVTAVGKERSKDVFRHIDETGVPHTDKIAVIFKDPKESPELKLQACLDLGISVFYDDRDDVCRLLNQNDIIAMRVTRKDNSTYDLQAEQK
jgi:acid phosphatase class B